MEFRELCNNGNNSTGLSTTFHRDILLYVGTTLPFLNWKHTEH